MELLKSSGELAAVEVEGIMELPTSPNLSSDSNSAPDALDGLTVLESELLVRERQKPDTFKYLSSLQVYPSHSRVLIPLCRLIPLPLVRPILEQDVKKLEAEFVHGYRSGDRPLYVSSFNDHGLEAIVTPQISSSWSTQWREASEKFDNLVEHDNELQALHGKMLFVWEGNHRYTAWWRFIENNYSGDRYNAKFYQPVERICIDPRTALDPLLDAMNDLNRSTELDHVKTNFVHKLHRIQHFGALPLSSFKGLISEDDIKTCEKWKKKVPTWYSLTVSTFIAYLYQREIASASDEACQEYKSNTPFEDQSPRGILEAMEKAAKATIKSIRNHEFEKYLAVADPGNGDEFFSEITRHWNKFPKPDMSLEKLQKIATANVEAPFKGRWLRWWNSSSMARESLHFPIGLVKEKILDQWLVRATFWAQLEAAVVREFEDISADLGSILWEAAPDILKIGDYVERWRISLWDKAFITFFKGETSFTKKSQLEKMPTGIQAIKRVLFRYLQRELIAKKAITPQALPPYLSSWIDKASPLCIYTSVQVQKWTLPHLQSGLWYLECPLAFCPAEEEDEKAKLLGQTSTIILEDDDDDNDTIMASKAVIESVATRKGKRQSSSSKLNSSKTTKTPKTATTTQAMEAPASIPHDTQVLDSCPSTIDLGTSASPSIPVSLTHASHSILRNTLQATVAGQGSSSLHSPVNVLIENTSIHDLMEAKDDISLMAKIHTFVEKVGQGRGTSVKSTTCTHGGFDLVVVDIPEGLPVPGVSSPPTAIPDWNVYIESHLEAVFEFAHYYLHSNAPLLIFMPESPTMRAEVYTYARTYDFKIFKDWWGFNSLRLASQKDPSTTTCRFRILLFVHNNTPPLHFTFQANSLHSSSGFNVVEDDVLLNLITTETQVMHGIIPWRGGREKDPLLLQILIEALTKPGGVVLDATASTGASIHACRRSRRHIVVLESDPLIFEAVLVPLQDKAPHTSIVNPPMDATLFDEDEVPIRHVAKRNRLSNLMSTLHSPERMLILPSYAEDLAQVFVALPSPPPRIQRPQYDYRIAKFLDIEAEESSNSGSSSIM